MRRALWWLADLALDVLSWAVLVALMTAATVLALLEDRDLLRPRRRTITRVEDYPDARERFPDYPDPPGA